MILRLPNGYETQIGEYGASLSAGQRQRVGLARALYGDPFLIVLDEPNSNLDADGDDALTQAITGARQRGAILIVIAHRPSALVAVDLVLMMSEGKVQALGPKDEVLGKMLRGARAGQAGDRRLVTAPDRQGRPWCGVMSSGSLDATEAAGSMLQPRQRPKVFPLGTPRGAGPLIGWARGAKPAGDRVADDE